MVKITLSFGTLSFGNPFSSLKISYLKKKRISHKGGFNSYLLAMYLLGPAPTHGLSHWDQLLEVLR
jgi:hypothetical protein